MYWGLSPLVISANTHRICFVSFPQAKLTWAGSEAMLGFWQAVSIWLCTVATLGGQPGLDRKMITAAIAMTAAIPATISTFLRDFGFLARPALRRPRSMRAWVRCWADGRRRPGSGQPGRPPVPMTVVRSSSGSSSSMTWCSASSGWSSKGLAGRGGVLLGWARSIPGRPSPGRCGVPSRP